MTPIPVLVSRARMPGREDLSAELAPIARRNALELSDMRWSYDVGRLIATLDELLGEITVRDGGVPEPPTPPARPAGLRLLVEGMVVAGATAFAARGLSALMPEMTGEIGEIAQVIVRRGATWALVGAAVAAWLAQRVRGGGASRVTLTGLILGAIAGMIGGAIWAVPVFHHDPYLIEGTVEHGIRTARRIEIGALAATGAIVGGLIASMWRPSRLATGLLAGAVAAALFQLFVIGLGWRNSSTFELMLTFGLVAAAVTGTTIGALLLLDRPRAAG